MLGQLTTLCEILVTTPSLLLWVMFLLLTPLVVTLHEAGHALTALLLTPHDIHVEIGRRDRGVTLVRGGRLTVAVDPLGSLRGGRVRTGGETQLWRFALIVAAGPLTSLVTAAVAACFAVALGPAHHDARWLAWFAVDSAVAGLANLVPLEDFPSDGRVLRHVWRLVRLRAARPEWEDPNVGTSVPPPR